MTFQNHIKPEPDLLANPKAIVFLDTEFTDLQNPKLLSIGLVALNGAEHYVELDLTSEVGKTRVKQSSDFVREVMLDFWGVVPGAGCTECEMGRRTVEAEFEADRCFQRLSKRGLQRHHALADALALRASYIEVKHVALEAARVRAKKGKGV